jgi:hypothetical protein
MSETVKKKSERVFHDAQAIAETRAIKRALEAKAGLPFVNMLIKEIFGGFDVGKGASNVRSQGRTETNVTPLDPESAPEESKELGREIHGMLKQAKDSGVLTREDCNRHWHRAMANMDKPSVLKQIIETLKREGGNGNNE